MALAALAVVFIFLPGGCEKKTAAPPPKRTPGDMVTVRLLTDDSGIDDKSFNAAAWRGILEYYGDTWTNPGKQGVWYNFVTAATQDMYVPNLRQATDEGYDLIVAAGFTWADPLAEVAAGNPGQKYLIVDVGGLELSNIMQAVYAEHEGSYLVGMAAALKALEDGIRNRRFGFIGGAPDPTITKFEMGYVQGILSVIPDAQIIDYYVNSWSEPALAKTQAKNWYDADVYAIYSAAGSSGNGTIAQAKEYRAAGRNVWAIGVDSDQYVEGLYTENLSAVLTSMIKRVESSMTYALEAVKDGSFSGEVINFDLAKGGVDYSTSNPVLNAAIIARLETAKQRIINGDISVAGTYAEARQLPGFPQDLKAIDSYDE
jgi:basic membrane protein A